MNKVLKVIVVAVLAFHQINAQSVSDAIYFDNYVSPSDNDFVNYFNGGSGLTLLTTNGITGGCLATPTTESWGNDNAIYCSKYIDSATYSTTTSISFKYDSTQLNAINYDRAVSLFLRPAADFNHYIIGSITNDKKIQIVSYFAANNPFLVNLVHGHWYDFILNTSCTTPAPVYQIEVTAELNDLGTTGLSAPVSAGASAISFTDSLLYVDTAVEVSFSGTLWGGASHLDNFKFQGWKSANSCTVTTDIEEAANNGSQVIVAGNTIYVSNDSESCLLEIYTSSGQRLKSFKLPSGNFTYSLKEVLSGVYLLKLSNLSHQAYRVQKFVVVD